MTTTKPVVQKNTDSEESTVNLQETAGSSNEKNSNNWTKETTTLVALGAIAFLILIAVVIKVIVSRIENSRH